MQFAFVVFGIISYTILARYIIALFNEFYSIVISNNTITPEPTVFGVDETSAMFWNINLIGKPDELDMIWSSSVASSSLAWFQILEIGRRFLDSKTRSDVDAICVKR